MTGWLLLHYRSEEKQITGKDYRKYYDMNTTCAHAPFNKKQKEGDMMGGGNMYMCEKYVKQNSNGLELLVDTYLIFYSLKVNNCHNIGQPNSALELYYYR